jgi:hypothetical protein
MVTNTESSKSPATMFNPSSGTRMQRRQKKWRSRAPLAGNKLCRQTIIGSTKLMLIKLTNNVFSGARERSSPGLCPAFSRQD